MVSGAPEEEPAVTDYWLRYYVRNGLCALCANTGRIDTRASARSVLGERPGSVLWCICPAGQAGRAASGEVLVTG